MSIFVDASAIVAIMTDEPGAFELEQRLVESGDLLCSPLSLWEAARALARKRTVTVVEAAMEVDAFIADFSLKQVSVGPREGQAAIVAHHRYGKGSGHRAKLNMGDCFAYACAKTNAARLLYKGDDFSHTDMAWPEPT